MATEYFQLEWTYTPPDFLEEPVKFSGPGYEGTMQDGLIIARAEPSAFQTVRICGEMLHREIKARLRAVQVKSHRVYELTIGKVTGKRSDGTEDAWAFFEPITIKLSVSDHFHAVLRDEHGNVIHDTNAERVRDTQEFMDQAARHSATDPTAEKLLASYSEAVSKPNVEFFRYFDIMETLEARFGSRKAATEELKLRDEFKQLGTIVNEKTYKQGRHRGQQVGSLQSAPTEIVSEARRLTRTLIESYFRYLDSQ